jgi:hypothetical protein
MKAVPAEADLLGIFDCSIWGEDAVEVPPFVHDRRSLPPTAANVLWFDSGVGVQVPERLGRLASGVTDKDLTLPCDALLLRAGGAQAMASLYLKYGERPWRKATQIPVTWMSFLRSSPMAWLVRSGTGSSSMESCSASLGEGSSLGDEDTEV